MVELLASFDFEILLLYSNDSVQTIRLHVKIHRIIACL